MIPQKPDPADFMKFPYGREERDQMTVHFDDSVEPEIIDPITNTVLKKEEVNQ